MVAFSMKYQSWYSRALEAVDVFLPARAAEFRDLYRPEKRKELSVQTYGIADFLLGFTVSRFGGVPAFDTTDVSQAKLLQQVVIIRAISTRLDSSLASIRSIVQADLFDSEIAAAKDLQKNGHHRAAGMVAGVVLERHLRTVCQTHKVSIRKKNPTLSDFNELLKVAEVIDVPTWRLIQRLGDIRSLAAHAKEREPTADEVSDLIAGAEKITKSVF